MDDMKKKTNVNLGKNSEKQEIVPNKTDLADMTVGIEAVDKIIDEATSTFGILTKGDKNGKVIGAEKELENIASQFSGLPMDVLIGGPLKAACDAQIMLAKATSDFIENIGFDTVDEKKVARVVSFSFNRKLPGARDSDGNLVEGTDTETVELSVPILSIVKIPSLSIDKVDITFDMEVKSSFSSKSENSKEGKLEAKAKFGFGPVSGNVSISGSISSHQANTRSSDNSAKYHVQVSASQGEMPEGLARVLDILNSAITPRTVSA